MDIRQRFSTTRILNPNTLTQKYLRRLYNISAGQCLILKELTSLLTSGLPTSRNPIV